MTINYSNAIRWKKSIKLLTPPPMDTMGSENSFINPELSNSPTLPLINPQWQIKLNLDTFTRQCSSFCLGDSSSLSRSKAKKGWHHVKWSNGHKKTALQNYQRRGSKAEIFLVSYSRTSSKVMWRLVGPHPHPSNQIFAWVQLVPLLGHFTAGRPRLILPLCLPSPPPLTSFPSKSHLSCLFTSS